MTMIKGSLYTLLTIILIAFGAASYQVFIKYASFVFWTMFSVGIVIAFLFAIALANTKFLQIRTQWAEYHALRDTNTAYNHLTIQALNQLQNGLIFPQEFNNIKLGAFPASPKMLPGGNSPDLELFGDMSTNDDIPKMVTLNSLIEGKPLSIRQLVLGVGKGGKIIKADIGELFHMLIAGTSRWGKSILLSSIVYQILKASEDSKVILIDPSENTFNDFGLPVASSDDDIVNTLSQVWGISQQRKSLFANPGGLTYRTLEHYNQNHAPLPYVFVIADEMTGVLDRNNTIEFNDQVSSLVSLITQRSAKYGIYLIVAGQDFKATVLPTGTRNQFSTRMQFKAMDATQARLLIPECEAHNIHVKGRAYIYVNDFGELMEIQTPYISPEEIYNVGLAYKTSANYHYHPEQSQPQSETINPHPNEPKPVVIAGHLVNRTGDEAKIIEIYDRLVWANPSRIYWSTISQEVWGHKAVETYKTKIRTALRKHRPDYLTKCPKLREK